MNPFDNLPNKTVAKIPDKAVEASGSDSKALQSIDSDMSRLAPGVALNPSQRDILGQYINAVKYGMSTFSNPMRCRGRECIMINKCPLSRANLELPVGNDCPVEKYFVDQKIEDLTKDLGINLKDLGSVYDKLLINDLASYELLEFRASVEMSEDPKIVKREIFGIGEDGTPLMTSQVNPIIVFKEKVAKAKMKILDELIATRKARAEDARANVMDRSSQIAAMLKRAKDNKIDTADTIEAHFTIDKPIDV